MCAWLLTACDREVARQLVCVWLMATHVLAAAAEPELIEWSKDRKLRRADFKSTQPLPQGMSARSLVTVEASWVCQATQLDVSIRAVFDPSRSSWGGSMASGFSAANARPLILNQSQVLQHEQTHFDIAELIARKIREHFAALTDVCTRPGGTIPLRAIVQDYQQDLDEEQARYDRETLFGNDARTQATWTSRTLEALKKSESKLK
jgi:uncharacterized protein DUF922